MKFMSDVFIHPLAVVDEGADIGDGTRIWHFAHVRETAKIGLGLSTESIEPSGKRQSFRYP